MSGKKLRKERRMKIISNEKEFEKIVKNVMDAQVQHSEKVVVETQPSIDLDDKKERKRKLFQLLQRVNETVDNIEKVKPIDVNQLKVDKPARASANKLLALGISVGIGAITALTMYGILSDEYEIESSDCFQDGDIIDEQDAINDIASDYYEEPKDGGDSLIWSH